MKTSNIEVALVDYCGSDLSVVNAARVSFAKESEWETSSDFYEKAPHRVLASRDARLINYLAEHGHLSPFNHSFLSFRVKAPIFVARQLVKHKFLPWNEVSRRYVDDEPEFYFPDGWRAKAADKKQGSGEVMYDNQPEMVISQTAEYAAQIALNTYTDMLAVGVSPEQARMVLPQNLMTEWIWSGTLGAFCAMLKLRLKEDTQQESREVASLIAQEVSQLFPISYNALLK